ncbi:MAG: NACHT domain-containing protein [Candidatus Electrothrix aestuarii]|uniref:NACHT domain-containing protein n=1 Tax=Candidatus Electrothrix aestuarii TaxID=3062594 RepID=A0AAU8LRR0_9BACT|nr:NACHT domain-containing protein [Candidatus Electrothrix aestuarii]
MQAAQENLCPYWLREQLLRRFRNDLSCRLESFFGEHGSVTLPKNFSPTDVSRAHSLREKIIEYSLEQAGSEARTIERDVVEIFNQPDINQRLAILGEPGSGKTSCLLRIFEHILKEAEQDTWKPMPVVFECSEWNGDPLPTWMAHQLVVKYDLKKERAKKLIQGELIFPFFDGLDELKGELQEGFVDAFNTFQQGRPMLLCCRITEYRQLKKKVQLNNALVLHDISAQRLEDYLRQEKLEDLWQLLQAEPALMELARRPLFLSIMLVLEEGKLLSDNDGLKKGEDAERFLWRLYLDCCLEGAPPSELDLTASRKKKYSKEQSLHWLRCLAGNMIANGQVELRIEEIQPTWLCYPQKFKTTYILGYGLLICLFTGIIAFLFYGTFFSVSYGVSVWLAFVLTMLLHDKNTFLGNMVLSHTTWAGNMLIFPVYGIFLGLLFNGAVYVLMGEYNQTHLPTDFSYYYMIKYKYIDHDNILFLTKIGLLGGGLTGVISGIGWIISRRTHPIINTFDQTEKIKRIKSSPFITFKNIKKFIIEFGQTLFFTLLGGVPFLGLLFGLTSGIVITLALGIAAGLPLALSKLETPVLDSSYPGQTISCAVRNSLLLTPLFSTISILAFVQAIFFLENYMSITAYHYMPSFYMLYLGIAFGSFLFSGSDIILSHYILRLLLWQEGQLPFLLVSWLEDLHQRKLLQRVGGSYHFIHKRLQEYLAQMNDAETVP